MRRLAQPLLIACALSAGCGEDDPKSPIMVDPLVLDGGDASPPTEAGPDVQPEASPGDSALPDAPAPVQLSATPCPALDLPGAADPLDGLRAMALTESRVFVAARDQLVVFERQGGCAGARLASLPVVAHSLGAGLGDSAVAGLADSTVLIDASGLIATCSDLPLRGLSMLPVLGSGFGVISADQVGRVTVSASDPDAGPSTCSVQPVSVVGSPFSVLAVAPELNQSSAIVALRRSAEAAPVLQRIPDPLDQDVSGPCSVRSLLHTALGAAVLDPTCSLLSIYGVDGETHRLAIPAGKVGRAIDTVPGTLTGELSLATVDEPGVAPELWVVQLGP